MKRPEFRGEPKLDSTGTILLGILDNKGYVTDLIIPEGVEEIADSALAHCYRLKRIKLPSTLRTIGKYAFAENWALEEIIIPKGVIEIRDYAFLGCEITRVVIPEGCETIGENVFFNSGLQIIYIPNTIRRIGKNAIFSFNNKETHIRIKYPKFVEGIENLYTPNTTLYIPRGHSGFYQQIPRLSQLEIVEE